MSVRIIIADVMDGLRSLPDESVNCVVTSPPYYGLRDYGQPGQIGLEPTPHAYVDRMVEVFREVRRVLRGDGTLWLNLGDSYGSAGGDIFTGFNERWDGTGKDGGKQASIGKNALAAGAVERKTGLRPKNLLGIPWRVAFALQADGWYLRQDIIWHKPNPMPESVTDRCTKAHEYIFLMSKSARYWFDSEAVREPQTTCQQARYFDSRGAHGYNAASGNHRDKSGSYGDGQTRNKRSVWTVPTQPYSGAHFATFPPDLIEPCIMAGAPAGGVILDTFGGAGTTGLVADRLGRGAILIELNPEYADMARKRIDADGGMFAAPSIEQVAPAHSDSIDLFGSAAE
jgi:DNA modification methylase